MDAQLVLDADGAEGVAVAQRPVGLHEEFRREEEADPLGPGRGVGQAREDHVDDVVGGVVVAPGDEDLLAGQRVGPVAVRRRGRRECAQIGAGVGFGQDHGPGPFAGDQLRKPGRLLILRAVLLQRLDGGERQHGAQAEGHVGGVHGLIGRQLQRLGQTLPAVLGRCGQAGPAAGGELTVGVRESGRGGHRSVGVLRPVQVARTVQGRQHVLRELARRLQHGREQVVVIIREAPGGGDAVDAGHGLQREDQVADGGAIGHASLI